MTVQLELWQLITLLLAFFGAVGWGTKIILDMIRERFAAQESAREAAGRTWAAEFASLRKESQEEGKRWIQVERDFLTFKADLPYRYVLREDYIRGQSILEAKQDALAARQDLAAEKLDNLTGRIETYLKRDEQ